MSRAMGRQPEDHRSELLRVLHVGDDDLAANRTGHLGPGQARRLVRSGYVNLGLAALGAAGLLAILMAVAERPFEPVQIILALTLAAALLIVGAAYLIRSLDAVSDGQVEYLVGPVALVMRGRAGWYLTVAEQSFKLPTRPWHVQNGAPYYVYIAPKLRRIVAMEPCDWAKEGEA